MAPAQGAPAWQEWRGSNPQPPVLETGALPVELHSFIDGIEATRPSLPRIARRTLVRTPSLPDADGSLASPFRAGGGGYNRSERNVELFGASSGSPADAAMENERDARFLPVYPSDSET